CFVLVPRIALQRLLLTLFHRVAARVPAPSALSIQTALSDEATDALVVVSMGSDLTHADDWKVAEPAARIVSATNRLPEDGAIGGIRSDLYYRIAGITPVVL